MAIGIKAPTEAWRSGNEPALQFCTGTPNGGPGSIKYALKRNRSNKKQKNEISHTLRHHDGQRILDGPRATCSFAQAVRPLEGFAQVNLVEVECVVGSLLSLAYWDASLLMHAIQGQNVFAANWCPAVGQENRHLVASQSCAYAYRSIADAQQKDAVQVNDAVSCQEADMDDNGDELPDYDLCEPHRFASAAWGYQG